MNSINDALLNIAPPPELESYRGMQNLRTLMVEPSIPQQKAITQQFEGEGVFDIAIVDSGEECLAAMDLSTPDLVVSAMYLPDMTGVDLIHAMRERDDYEYIPFLLISSESNIERLEPVRQAGVVGILPKPFELRDLQRALCAAYDLRFSDHLRQSSKIDFGSLDVLLVDDSLLSRNHLRRVVENLGICRIDEAENGVKATELLGEKSYDLLLTDYHMPEMDGRELLEFVRKDSKQKALPALIVTSEQSMENLAWLDDFDHSAFCDKPFEPREIGNFIERLLQH